LHCKAALLILTLRWSCELQSTHTAQKESKQCRRQFQVQIFALYIPAKLGGCFFTSIIEKKRYVIPIVSSQIRGRSVVNLLWLLFSSQSHNSEKLGGDQGIRRENITELFLGKVLGLRWAAE
jgi:hypothetical protein